MKLITKEDAESFRSATINGGLRGAAIGASISLPLHFLLRTRPQYARIPPSLRALGYVCIIVPAISISAEKAGEAYDRSKWEGSGKRELDRIEANKETAWESMSSSEKVRDWGTRNKWGLIAGAWAASMGIAFGLVARTPQTFTQKLVQARMWAQGLTVGTLISSAIIAGVHSTDDKMVERVADHSWIDLLEQEGTIKKEDLDKIREAATGKSGSKSP